MYNINCLVSHMPLTRNGATYVSINDANDLGGWDILSEQLGMTRLHTAITADED
jgi:hypothetical protein